MASSNVVQFPANPDTALPVSPAKRRRGKQAKLPGLEFNSKSIDPKELLLSGQSDPSVPLTAEIQAAIDRRASVMAREAYDLCREHLARRVAYTSEFGQPRFLDRTTAIAEIRRCDLGEALAHEYFRELRNCAVTAGYAARSAAKFSEEINRIVGAGEYSND